MEHNLDTEFALLRVRTLEIWCRQRRAVNHENLDEAEFMKPSSVLSQGRSRARQGGARPMAPLGYKYNPLGGPRRLSIHPFIREPLTRRRSTTGMKWTTVASPRVA
jgi:hypothetical protein